MPAAQKLITGNYFVIGGRFLEIRTPGGLPDPNPGFSETQITFFFLGLFYRKKYVGEISKNK